MGHPLFIASIFFHRLWLYALALFLIGWVFQFIGHAFEFKPPEFFHDWRFLFVGVAGGGQRSTAKPDLVRRGTMSGSTLAGFARPERSRRRAAVPTQVGRSYAARRFKISLPSFCASPKNFWYSTKIRFRRAAGLRSACGEASCRARARDSARSRLRSILPVRSKDCSDTSHYFTPLLFVPVAGAERSIRYLELTHSKRAFGGASRRVGMGATALPWRKKGS